MFGDIQPITLSARAVEEILKIMHTKKIPEGYGLRVGVRGGGCGASIIIGFDKKKPTDLSYVLNDITVHVDKRHTMYLIGKQVDFYDGEDARGFLVNDPSETNDTTAAL